MWPILILAFISFSLCILMIAFSYLFGDKDKGSPMKEEAYECGLVPSQKASSRVPVKFFLTAILFILFDIEIIFMYPFALAYRDFLTTDYGLSVLLAMGLFLLIFIFGLWWEIKTKALDWK